MTSFPSLEKALKKRILLLISAFFFIPITLLAQFRFDASCKETYSAITSLRFGAAVALLEKEKKTDPENLVPVYLENYMDFIAAFTGEDQKDFDRFMKEYPDRERKIENSREPSPFYHYFLGNMKIQRGLLRIKWGEFRSAASDLTGAYKELLFNDKEYPAFLPDKTGLGMIHIMRGLIPYNYQWLLSLLGIKGDFDLGLSEIRSVAGYSGNSDLISRLQTEAIFFLSFVDSYMAKDRTESLEAIRMAEKQAGQAIMDNPLYIYAKASILLRCGRNEEALSALSNYRRNPGDFPLYVLDFLTGKAKLNRLDPDADRYLIRFLLNYRGKNFIKSGYQKLAWSYLLKRDTARYNEFIEKARTRGAALMDNDRQAMREAEKKERPNLILLKSRLLFDGGYYGKALDVLGKSNTYKDFHSQKDLSEYYYRMGRIYQDSGVADKALNYFRIAFAEGKDLPYYYAANAALQSGLIYEKRGDFPDAISQYRLCLSLDYDEYRNSLNQKARAGLNRIAKKSR